MRIPGFFKGIVKYVSPLYLIAIFVLWILFNVFGWNPNTGQFKPTGYVLDLVGSADTPPNTVARLSVGLIAIIVAFTLLLAHVAGRRWDRLHATAKANASANPNSP